MLTKISYCLVLATLCLGLGACRSTNKSASTSTGAPTQSVTAGEKETYSYEFTKEDQKTILSGKSVVEKGCSTQRKTLKSLEEMCSTLVNEKANNECAKKERMELYEKSGCATVPGIFPVAGILSCDARMRDDKKIYKIKINGIANKLAFVGEVPAKLPRVIYAEGKTLNDKAFSNGALQIGCAKTVLITNNDVTQQVVCKVEVIDQTQRSLIDTVQLIFQLDRKAEGIISVSHSCDGSSFELMINNCK